MSRGGQAIRDAEQASQIQQGLMRNYAGVGAPIVRDTQAYIRGALEGGEPGYIRDAYAAARTGAGEEASQVTQGLMGRTAGLSGGALLRGLVGATAAGGRAFVEERAGVSASRAMNTFTQRNNLLKLLAGQGAQQSNLSQGFGRLGMAAIGQQMQGGDPFYEAVVGLGSAGATGYLSTLMRPQPDYWVGGTQAAGPGGYFLGNVPGGAAAGYPRSPGG